MSKWVMDQSGGPLDYPTLGVVAAPGDILDSVSAPDARWTLNANQAAAETVFRYALGSDPDYVEPTNGHVLTWDSVQNKYVPTAPEVVGMPSVDAVVATKIDNPLSAVRGALDPYLAAGYADKATQTTVATGRLSEANLSATYVSRLHLTTNRPAQSATQVVGGRIIVGVANGGQNLLAWNGDSLAQSNNLGAGWQGRNLPADVGPSYSTAGKACAVIFKGKWYLQAVKNSDGLPSLFRCDQVNTDAGVFSWSGPLVTGKTGSAIFSSALAADDQYIYWGEYGDPVGGPSLYRSADGTTWTECTGLNTIGRHIHGVAVDPYNPGHVWVTGGDTTSTRWNFRSTDYGATWAPLPGALGTDAAWQSCQISFDANFIYLAPDTITSLSVVKVDRATLTPTWGAKEAHRLRAVPGGLPSRTVSDLSTTEGLQTVTSLSAAFTQADVGSMLRTIGQDIVPIGTYIKTVDSATQVTLWQAAKYTASGVRAVFGGEQFGAATYYGDVDPTTGIYYLTTLNGAFGGNVDGLFAVYPDGDLVLLSILTTSPDGRVWVCPAVNRIYAAHYIGPLLSV